jgi:hypothetical protein
MTAVTGQASVEYAGLLGLAAVLGAVLALVAGPPLLGAVRNSFIAALSGRAHSPAPVVAGAADIADVQSALLPTADGLTPEAALLALGQRHSKEDARELADSLLLAAARATAPWLGEARSYRAWIRPQDGPYEPMAGDAHGDRDVERASGPPVVAWVTLEAQRQALAAALAHHTNRVDVGLDLVGLIPFGKLVRWSFDAVAHPFATGLVTTLPKAIERGQDVADAIAVVHPHDGGVPAGMRAGDVVVSWPVHRSYWRSGRSDPAPRAFIGHGHAPVPLARDYVHVVVLRPGVDGLAVISEGFGT